MHSVRLLLILLPLLAVALRAAAISITQFNLPVTENFDTLATSGTSSSLPAGWSFSETGSGANTTYAAGTGSSATGDTYSFGAAASTDRALGTLLTSSLASTLSATFLNNTSGILTQLAIAYDGEQWRLGSTSRTDRLDFAYSLDGTNWIDVDALDFLAPNSSGTVGALDGNATANRVAISFTITGLNVADGGSLFLRWSDFPAAGSDDGLAIDNFSITAMQTNPPPTVAGVPDRLSLGSIAAVFFGLLLCGSTRVGAGPRECRARRTSP